MPAIRTPPSRWVLRASDDPPRVTVHLESEFDGVGVYTISEDGIEPVKICFDQSSKADHLGLTFPANIGQLPKLAIGALRNAL